MNIQVQVSRRIHLCDRLASLAIKDPFLIYNSFVEKVVTSTLAHLISSSKYQYYEEIKSHNWR